MHAGPSDGRIARLRAGAWAACVAERAARAGWRGAAAGAALAGGALAVGASPAWALGAAPLLAWDFRGLRLPGWRGAARWAESRAGLAHRPLSTFGEPCAGGEAALWPPVVAAKRAALSGFRVPWPRPGVARADPWGLRYMAVALLVLGAGLSWSDEPLLRRFDPQMNQYDTAARVITGSYAPGQGPQVTPAVKALLEAMAQGAQGAPRVAQAEHRNMPGRPDVPRDASAFEGQNVSYTGHSGSTPAPGDEAEGGADGQDTDGQGGGGPPDAQAHTQEATPGDAPDAPPRAADQGEPDPGQAGPNPVPTLAHMPLRTPGVDGTREAGPPVRDPLGRPLGPPRAELPAEPDAQPDPARTRVGREVEAIAATLRARAGDSDLPPGARAYYARVLREAQSP